MAPASDLPCVPVGPATVKTFEFSSTCVHGSYFRPTVATPSFAHLFRASEPQLGRPASTGAQLQTLSLAPDDLYFDLESNPNEYRSNFGPHLSITFLDKLVSNAVNNRRNRLNWILIAKESFWKVSPPYSTNILLSWNLARLLRHSQVHIQQHKLLLRLLFNSVFWKIF